MRRSDKRHAAIVRNGVGVLALAAVFGSALRSPAAEDPPAPTVALGIRALALVVDDAGKRALIGGIALNHTPDDDWGPRNPDMLLLVDLEARKVVARRQLDVAAAALHLDEAAAYVAPERKPVLRRLELGGLTDQGRLFLDEPATGIEALPGKRLLLATESGVVCCSTDPLEEIPQPGIPSEQYGAGWGPSLDWDAEQLTGRHSTVLRDGTFFNGVVWGAGAGTPQLLVRCAEIPEVRPPQTERGRVTGSPDLDGTPQADWYPRLWGRSLIRGNLLDRALEPIAGWDFPSAVLMRRFPAVAALNLEPPRDEREFQIMSVEDGNGRFVPKLTLQFHELSAGGLRGEAVLMHHPIRKELLLPAMFASDCRPLLADAGQSVVATYWDECFIVPVPEAVRKLPPPVCFAYKQDRLWAPAGEQVTLAFQASGGKGAIAYRTPSDVPWVVLDGGTGRVTVDTGAAWRESLRPIASSQVDERTADQLRQAVAAARAEFEQLFGKPPDGVPVAVNVQLVARDEEQATDLLAAQLVVLGPTAEFEQAVASAQAALARAIRERQEQEQQERIERLARAADQGGPLAGELRQAVQSAGELLEDVNKLSERVDQLETAAAPARVPTSAGPPDAPEALGITVRRHLEAADGRIADYQGRLDDLEQAAKRRNGMLRLTAVVFGLASVALVALAVLTLRAVRQRASPRTRRP